MGNCIPTDDIVASRSDNSIVVATVVAVTFVSVLIIISLVVLAIIIRKKKLRNSYNTDNEVKISEEIPEYASVAIVQLRSAALPPPPPPRTPGTSAETVTMPDPRVDRNPAYGQAIPPSIDMQSNPAYEQVQTRAIPSPGGGYEN